MLLIEWLLEETIDKHVGIFLVSIFIQLYKW